jgi:hypothetical protein
MHLRTLPYDRPSPPAPRPVRRQRTIIESADLLLWVLTMILIAIGVAT